MAKTPPNPLLEAARAAGVPETAEFIVFATEVAGDVKEKLADGRFSVGDGIGLVIGNYSVAKSGLTGLQRIDDEFKFLATTEGGDAHAALINLIDDSLGKFGVAHRDRDAANWGLDLLRQNIVFALWCANRPPAAVAVGGENVKGVKE